MKKITIFLKSLSDKMIYFGWILLKWSIIIAALIGFFYLSILITKLIGDKPYIVFILDLVFCLLCWIMLNHSKHMSHDGRMENKYMKKILFLVALMIILFIFIALSTFGIEIYYESRTLFNIFLLPFLFFITIALNLHYHSINWDKNNINENKQTLVNNDWDSILLLK